MIDLISLACICSFACLFVLLTLKTFKLKRGLHKQFVAFWQRTLQLRNMYIHTYTHTSMYILGWIVFAFESESKFGLLLKLTWSLNAFVILPNVAFVILPNRSHSCFFVCFNTVRSTVHTCILPVYGYI